MAHTTQMIRNVALCGHSGAGKTSLAEALIFNMGETNRLGRISDGTTVSDYSTEEIERQISLNISLLHGTWNDHHVNIIDTPGYADFIAEAKGALRVADGAIVAIDATSGLAIGTERVWEFCSGYALPRLILINKVDRQDIDIDEILADIQDRFGRQIVPLQMPVNPGEGFNQIVDLVDMQLLTFDEGNAVASEIPDQLVEAVQDLREQLIEAVAETDEGLMDKYFAEGELGSEDLVMGLRKAFTNRELYPVLYADAFNNVGVRKLLDNVLAYFPTPGESPGLNCPDEKGGNISLEGEAETSLTSLVFKTVAEQHVGELALLRLYTGSFKPGDEVTNPGKRYSERIGQMFQLNGQTRTEVEGATAGDIVALVKLKDTQTGDTLCAKGGIALPAASFPEPLIRVAIHPREQGNEDKVAAGLSQLRAEDPSLGFAYDSELKQSILSTQGELHLEIVLSRLRERFGVEIETEAPRVPYRETIRDTAEAHYRHKKQSGGRGQFGEVFLRVNPCGRGQGFEFANEVVGGNIPGNFIPAVEKGIAESLEEGPASGYQVVDVVATVYDGKHHPVDSDEVSFKLAGSHAFREAFMKARPVLLEPIYTIGVTVPEDYMGDVMGDLSSRRGRISGTDAEGHFQTITAEVPLAEIDRYATTLRSMTQGRGVHTQEFVRYQEVPGDIMTKIVEAAQKEKEAA